jgi:hypothetical protein
MKTRVLVPVRISQTRNTGLLDHLRLTAEMTEGRPASAANGG